MANSSPKITRIKKRDGRIVKYDIKKIATAIFKALMASNNKTEEENQKLANKLAKAVEKKLIQIFGESNRIPGVEDIQDLVEATLLENKEFQAVQNYIEYRQNRRAIREEKKQILNHDSLTPIEKKFSLSAIRVLASRYLVKNKEGKIIEPLHHLFERVAVTAALPEILYDPKVMKKLPKIQPPPYKPKLCIYEDIEYVRDPEVKKFLSQISEKLLIVPEKIQDLHSGFKIGKYHLLYGHLQRLAVLYDELKHTTKAIKISFTKLLDLISSGYFDKLVPLISRFYDIMANQQFMPNSPTLMNAGLRLGQLSACFVVDIEDDIKSILTTNMYIGTIFKSGGGVGANYSKLRPKGALVKSTGGQASGPISFMEIINTTTQVIKQGGKRRGANMGILNVNHPDIEEFITVKEDLSKLTNFNLSVGFLGDFWEHLIKKEKYPLTHPNAPEIRKEVDPDLIIDTVAFSAWRSAEPGVLFFDNINKHNILKEIKGEIRATNPCGEQPLYPYESCNLGSINLAAFVKDGEFDFPSYRRVIKIAVHFMDNISSINRYPMQSIRYNTLLSRKIGLGIMGLANLLFKLMIPYNSKEAFELMDRLAEELAFWSMKKSVELAKEKGAFPLFEKSGYVKGKLPLAGVYTHPKPRKPWKKLISEIQKHGIRNSYTTTLAPTGSISMIADTSSGLEPEFALVYKKVVPVGEFYVVNPVFEKYLECNKRYPKQLKEKVADNFGSIQTLTDDFTEEERKVFVTSADIHWLDHIVAQSVWQVWNSSSISKTINMAEDVTPTDVKHSYLLGHELGLKGLTVYREGSRESTIQKFGKSQKFTPVPSLYAQEKLEAVISTSELYNRRSDLREELINILHTSAKNAPNQIALLKNKNGKPEAQNNSTKEEHLEKCPVCGGKIVHEAGCEKCIECGWSACPVS